MYQGQLPDTSDDCQSYVLLFSHPAMFDSNSVDCSMPGFPVLHPWLHADHLHPLKTVDEVANNTVTNKVTNNTNPESKMVQ